MSLKRRVIGFLLESDWRDGRGEIAEMQSEITNSGALVKGYVFLRLGNSTSPGQSA
jgi:hypothetical protein